MLFKKTILKLINFISYNYVMMTRPALNLKDFLHDIYWKYYVNILIVHII